MLIIADSHPHWHSGFEPDELVMSPQSCQYLWVHPPCNQILLWANNEKILETLGHPRHCRSDWGTIGRCEVRVIVWRGASVIINIPRSCQHSHTATSQPTHGAFYISIVWQGYSLALSVLTGANCNEFDVISRTSRLTTNCASSATPCGYPTWAGATRAPGWPAGPATPTSPARSPPLSRSTWSVSIGPRITLFCLWP